MSRNREGPPDLLSMIKKLTERVQKLESSGRLGFSSINVGNFTVDGARFIVRVSDVEVLRIANDVGGNGQPGFRFRYADGSSVMTCYGDAAGQFWGIWNSGQIVMSTDGGTKFGIARPHLPIPFTRPWENAPVNTITSGTFVKVAFAKLMVQHPKVYLLLSARTSDGTTAGEYQVTLAGTVLGTTTISAGTFALLEFSARIDDIANFGQFYDLEVWARRTAGAGNIGLDVLQAWSQQS